MNKRGLLILVGGRPLPNFLSARSCRPDILAPIVTEESLNDGSWDVVRGAVSPFCKHIADPLTVGATDLTSIKAACHQHLSSFPDAEWIFNVTSGTAVMSIGAYEVARVKGADCWYVNTDRRVIVPLFGDRPREDLFTASIDEYVSAYGKSVADRGSSWITPDIEAFVERLARDLDLAKDFHASLRRGPTGPNGIRYVKSDNAEVADLWRQAFECDLVQELDYSSDSSLRVTVGSLIHDNFLNGDWLSAWVWMVAKCENLFDDVEFSFTIPTANTSTFEIDFGLTWGGMLLIAECKTGHTPFKGKHLRTLNGNAAHIGSNFVARMFITNEKLNDSLGVDEFSKHAEEQRVVIVDRERFREIGDILKQESGASGHRPTFPRY